MNEETVTIKTLVETGFVGGDHEDEFEYPKKAWDAMNSEEQQDFLNEAAQEAVGNTIHANAWVKKEEI